MGLARWLPRAELVWRDKFSASGSREFIRFRSLRNGTARQSATSPVVIYVSHAGKSEAELKTV
jgi:hypothetical protein